MATPTTHPDAAVRRTRRAVTLSDAITGAALAAEGATMLRSLLLFLESQCGSGPVKENAHLGMEEHVQAALVMGWDALNAVECGATQAHSLLQELQAQEPAVTA